MAGEWRRLPLSAVAELSGGFAFKSKDYASAGRFVLRTLNIRDDCSISREDAVFLPEELWPEYSRFELQPADTLFVMVGATLGKIGYVRSSDLPALLNQNMWCIRAKPGIADARFIHYAFRLAVKSSLGWASGSARDFVRRDDYRNLEIFAPSLIEQKAVGSVLGTLDEKIHLNRRVNETLEGMARALFKSWFVDFDPVRSKAEGIEPASHQRIAGLFPDSFDLFEDREIPKGWKVVGLDTIARFLNGLALQKFPPKGDHFLPVIKIAQLRSEDTSDADKASSDLAPEYVVDDGDVLFSWSGSLECILWAGGRGALNQHLFKVTSQVYPKWFYYLWIEEHLPEFRPIASGKATTMGHIQRGHLSAAKVLVPQAELLTEMDRFFAPLIQQIVNLKIASRTLAAIRDALLPKLISGQLRVPDAEKIAGGQL